MSFFQGIKLVMGHGPYAKLVMVFLFTSLAFMVRFGKHYFLYVRPKSHLASFPLISRQPVLC